MTPSGSFVAVGFVELNQIINGPISVTSGTPISTTAKVLAVSKRNVIEVAHHSRDTECYTVRNTHDCSQVYVKEATGPDTSHVMPAGSFEVERTLVDEYQMKNA